MSSSFITVLLLFTSLCSTDGFMNYEVDRCVFNSTELSGIEFIRSYYFNKLEHIRFSSSLGKFVGYTEFGVMNAERFNKDPGELAAMRAQKGTYCQHNIKLWYQAALTKSVKPEVVLYSTTPSGGHHPDMLVCSVYSFYPKTIKVSWTRDGQEVTSDVTTTEELQNGDWYYQTHSHLEYTPRSGEKISCVVEHASLKEPLITDWNSSMPQSEKIKFAFGGLGLILGLILPLSGFIYYRKKARVPGSL